MASGRAIDHVVLAVKELDRAASVFEDLGFTLTPRAQHEDRMGTSNRLAQFRAGNFIELLEADRPEKLAPHAFSASPPFFSFGEHNRLAAAEREGLSMVAFASEDAKADMEGFRASGVSSFAPFDFERAATLPGGGKVTVAFSLAFVQSPAMPEAAFFVSQNRFPNHFWKNEYQVHENAAAGIVAVYLSSPDPGRDAAFIARMFGGEVTPCQGGSKVACGPQQELRILTPQAIAEHDRSFGSALRESPILAGIVLATEGKAGLTPSSQACGMFIEWTPV